MEIVRYEEKNNVVVAVKHWGRHPECLWNLYLRKFLQLGWIRLWTAWSNFEVSPALSRRLDWITPDVPSNLSPSAVIRTSRKRHVTTLKITLFHHINSLLTYSSIIVCCLAPSLKNNILELEIVLSIKWLIILGLFTLKDRVFRR